MYVCSGVENYTALMLTIRKGQIIYKLSLSPSKRWHQKTTVWSKVQTRTRPSKWRGNACTFHLGHRRGSHKWLYKQIEISPNFNELLKAKSEPLYHSGIAAGPDTRVHGSKCKLSSQTSTGAHEEDWGQVRRLKRMHLGGTGMQGMTSSCQGTNTEPQVLP